MQQIQIPKIFTHFCFSSFYAFIFLTSLKFIHPFIFCLKLKSVSPPLVCAPISTSISDLFANQTPSVPSSPTCQEQLPDALLTTLLTTLLHLPWPAARRCHWAIVASESHCLLVQTHESKDATRCAQKSH